MSGFEGNAHTKAGATLIADTIIDYWAKRGGRVRATVEAVENNKIGITYCVKTDLVNGIPRGFVLNAQTSRLLVGRRK